MERGGGSSRVINGQWELRDKLGTGGFGAVYRAVHIRTGTPAAVKVAHGKHGDEVLRAEHRVYAALRNTSTEIVGVPRALYFGRDLDETVLVMELLGKSLDRALTDCAGRFSLKTTLMVGVQMLRRLQLVHHKGFIHRDVKPENMIIGRPDNDRVYLVDFGVTKKYRDYTSRKHVPPDQARTIVGSVMYISLNAHKGIEHARRDDLESLGYSMVYMFKGSLPWQEFRVLLLPWQNARAFSEWRLYSMIYNKKRKTTLEKLCQGMPPQMVEYFKYVRGLRFDERPDYARLRDLLRRALKASNLREDRVFDWMEGCGARPKGRR